MTLLGRNELWCAASCSSPPLVAAIWPTAWPPASPAGARGTLSAPYRLTPDSREGGRRGALRNGASRKARPQDTPALRRVRPHVRRCPVGAAAAGLRQRGQPFAR